MMKFFKQICAPIFILIATTANADNIKLAVTTSFNNSGLSDVLLPKIKSDIGLNIKLLVVGTGQALRLGAAGDVDAILVHSKKAEERFVTDGYGLHRREIMYNDFVIIGPKHDPASVRNSKSVREALTLISQTPASFVSRGDDSGTHKMEVGLWKYSSLDPDKFGKWYKSCLLYTSPSPRD